MNWKMFIQVPKHKILLRISLSQYFRSDRIFESITWEFPSPLTITRFNNEITNEIQRIAFWFGPEFLNTGSAPSGNVAESALYTVHRLAGCPKGP